VYEKLSNVLQKNVLKCLSSLLVPVKNKKSRYMMAIYPRELLTVTSRYGASCIFYTDDFLDKGS
jgi:hypothetical protein